MSGAFPESSETSELCCVVETCRATTSTKWGSSIHGPRTLCCRCYTKYYKHKLPLYKDPGTGDLSIVPSPDSICMRISGFHMKEHGKFRDLGRPIVVPHDRDYVSLPGKRKRKLLVPERNDGMAVVEEQVLDEKGSTSFARGRLKRKRETEEACAAGLLETEKDVDLAKYFQWVKKTANKNFKTEEDSSDEEGDHNEIDHSDESDHKDPVDEEVDIDRQIIENWHPSYRVEHCLLHDELDDSDQILEEGWENDQDEQSEQRDTIGLVIHIGRERYESRLATGLKFRSLQKEISRIGRVRGKYHVKYQDNDLDLITVGSDSDMVEMYHLVKRFSLDPLHIQVGL